MTPVPVPAAAVSQLLPFIQRWREAEAAMQDAVGLVLAAMGAPQGAVIKLEPDGTMFVVVGNADNASTIESADS